MSSVRLRRLQADYQKLSEYVKRHPRLRLIQKEGDPPELYQIEYHISGLRQTDDQLALIKSHIVEIALPRDYPRTPPQCRMLTPVFHPNIAPHAICIGDHWAAGEPLWAMAARIGEMISFQSYNTKSPLNGEAARWADENVERLPLDPVSMILDEPESAKAASPAAAQAAPVRKTPVAASPPDVAAPSQPPAAIEVVCPSCQARYRIPPQNAPKRARCKKCQTIIEIPQ